VEVVFGIVAEQYVCKACAIGYTSQIAEELEIVSSPSGRSGESPVKDVGASQDDKKKF
jgi:hypothetical protein